MVVTFTADQDCDDKKNLYSWSFSQGTGAQTINFRRGSLAGAIVFAVQLPTGTSSSQSYAKPLRVAEGWFIDVVGTGLNFGMVDVG